jgi:hypothetical protein
MVTIHMGIQIRFFVCLTVEKDDISHPRTMLTDDNDLGYLYFGIWIIIIV